MCCFYYELSCQASYTTILWLKIIFNRLTVVRKVNAFISTGVVRLRMLMFGILIAYDVYIKIKVLEYRYDLKVKGQDQIYSISVSRIITRHLLAYFDGGCS